MNEAERALINECRRRVQELKDDPDVTTVDGRNYRASGSPGRSRTASTPAS